MPREYAQRQAYLHDQDRGKLERLGAQASTSVGRRARFSVLRAWQRGNDWRGPLIKRMGELEPLIADAMLAAYLYGRRRVQITASKAMGKKIKLSTAYTGALQFIQQQMQLSDDQLKTMREEFAPKAGQVILKAESHVEGKILKSIEQITTQGLHTRGGVMVLQKTFDNAGITPENSFLLEGIFRTQIQLAYGAGRWAALRDPIIDDIVWGFEYFTVGDDRVRPNHIAMDGIRLPKDDPFWAANWPPNGHACRCEAIEIFEGDALARPSRTVKPKPKDIEGERVVPVADDGFQFNAGTFFQGVTQEVSSRRADDRLVLGGKSGNKRVADGIGDAIQAVAQIHQVRGTVAKTAVRIAPPGTKGVGDALGRLTWHEDGQTRITIASDTPHPRLTMLEETGHLLDVRAWGPDFLQPTSRQPGVNPQFDAILDAAISSDGYRRALRAANDSNLRKTSRDFAELQLERDELFAKAYIQFIAKRSGGKIKQEFDRHRERRYFWDDDDFEPIDQAMERLFEASPWAKYRK